MKAKTLKLGWRPTQLQELLVQAALLQGDQAIQAWERWERGLVFDTLDPCSRQLLPLLHRNLRAHGIDHPLMERFKGIHRYTWYKNQLMLNKTAQWLRAFHDAGIETMLLKGAALVLLHYDTYGLRPMRDVDVLVHTDKAVVAMDLLKELGFTTQSSALVELTMSYVHAKEFKDQDGNGFDLHWNALRECRQADADDAFWNNAVITEINDVPTHALSPTDQLLHVCVHAARWEAVPRLIWIADAMTILNSAPSIDWDRLILCGRKRRITLLLRDTLAYLHNLLDAPIPATVLQRLRETPISKAERIEYGVANRPSDGAAGRARTLWLMYRWYAQSPNGADLQHQRFGFARFLQHYWAVPHLRAVPFHAAAKTIRKIGNSIL